jgi:hypothetical protein
MSRELPLPLLIARLDAIEEAERRFADQEIALNQKQQNDLVSIDTRRHSDIKEAKRLSVAFDKIHHAIDSELKKVGLGTIAPGSVSMTDNFANPKLEDLSTLLKQVGKRSSALEASLRELEHHRDLQAKAARTVHALKSQPRIPTVIRPSNPPPRPSAPPSRLITPPPPPLPRLVVATQPAKNNLPLTLGVLVGAAVLAIALLLYYLLHN